MQYHLAQANPFSAIQIDPASLIVGLTNALQLLFILVAFGGVVFFLVKKKVFIKFPTTALIFRMRGEKMFLVDEDKARRVKNKKDGEIYYEFRKRSGLKWKPPSFEFLTATTKNKSVMFLKELAQDDFEIIDPKIFISTTSDAYERVEGEEMDKFYKNTQDEKARNKWKQESSWQKLLNALPILMSIMGIALFFYIFGQYVAIPMIQQFGGQFQQAAILNNQSQTLLDKSTSYLDLLLRQQNGQSNTILYVCPNGRTVASPNLCFTGNSTP